MTKRTFISMALIALLFNIPATSQNKKVSFDGWSTSGWTSPANLFSGAFMRALNRAIRP